MVVGYIFELALIILLGWHVVAAIRRYRANRPERLRQRAIAAARTAPVPSLYGDNPLGDC